MTNDSRAHVKRPVHLPKGAKEYNLLFKLGQHVCEDRSVFNIFLYGTTLFKQAEYVALLWNI